MLQLSAKAAIAGFLAFAAASFADPVPVRHAQGFLHGYVVLRDLSDKILASGDVKQLPSGNRVTTVLALRFKDGSLHEETSVFSQRRVFQLLRYKLVQRGPAFKTPTTLSFETSTGNVAVTYADKNGKPKTVTKHLTLPADLANGMVSTLLSEVDPKAETVVSMVVSTPEPRVVKLKISANAGPETFSIGGVEFPATHYTATIDIGGVPGVVAKVAGKQPPPLHFWTAAGDAPMFLKSEGQLFDDGPVWRIELASPAWPKSSPKQ
jgi:hypothetical protein